MVYDVFFQTFLVFVYGFWCFLMIAEALSIVFGSLWGFVIRFSGVVDSS